MVVTAQISTNAWRRSYALASDAPLEPRVHDHALVGPWADFHDCHVKPDLVLIYQKADPGILRLVRIGSHAELGL